MFFLNVHKLVKKRATSLLKKIILALIMTQL